MERNLLIAGFGGQGVMMLGTLLALSACDSTDKNVTYFPSYGAEMRGGAANCYVVISDDQIGGPMPGRQEDLIAMNEVSLLKYIGNVKPGGNVFINSSIINCRVEREDVNIISAPVTELSMDMGNPKAVNLIMLGVYIGVTDIMPAKTIEVTIRKKLGKKKPELLELNLRAFNRGLEIGRNYGKKA